MRTCSGTKGKRMQKTNWILYRNTHSGLDETKKGVERRVLSIFVAAQSVGLADIIAKGEMWIPFNPHGGSCVCGFKRVRIEYVERGNREARVHYATFDHQRQSGIATIRRESTEAYVLLDDFALERFAEGRAIYITPAHTACSDEATR
jgi:hypothetical protein